MMVGNEQPHVEHAVVADAAVAGEDALLSMKGVVVNSIFTTEAYVLFKTFCQNVLKCLSKRFRRVLVAQGRKRSRSQQNNTSRR
jgi:hypothetical protein